MTAYLAAAALVGLGRNKSDHPALSNTAAGLVLVCAVEVLSFGLVFGLAWVASRATVDDLLMRWKNNFMPVLLGAGYSVALRVGVGICFALLAGILVAARVETADSLEQLAKKNRPDVETVVDVAAMKTSPAYLWLTITLVSFVVGGLREEVWRSSFLTGLQHLWPGTFTSTGGKIGAVVIAAVIFGLGHVSMGLLAAAMAGLLGLGLGLIMIFHRSIWPAVIAHGCFDATSMAMIPWALELMKQLPKH